MDEDFKVAVAGVKRQLRRIHYQGLNLLDINFEGIMNYSVDNGNEKLIEQLLILSKTERELCIVIIRISHMYFLHAVAIDITSKEIKSEGDVELRLELYRTEKNYMESILRVSNEIDYDILGIVMKTNIYVSNQNEINTYYLKRYLEEHSDVMFETANLDINNRITDEQKRTLIEITTEYDNLIVYR